MDEIYSSLYDLCDIPSHKCVWLPTVQISSDVWIQGYYVQFSNIRAKMVTI